MKKTIQHIVLGLFCFMGLVLASPNWFIAHARPMSNAWHITLTKNSNNNFPVSDTTEPAPSILEGTARFACW